MAEEPLKLASSKDCAALPLFEKLEFIAQVGEEGFAFGSQHDRPYVSACGSSRWDLHRNLQKPIGSDDNGCCIDPHSDHEHARSWCGGDKHPAGTAEAFVLDIGAHRGRPPRVSTARRGLVVHDDDRPDVEPGHPLREVSLLHTHFADQNPHIVLELGYIAYGMEFR